MRERVITKKLIRLFAENLIREEKSTATVEKYLRDVRAFFVFVKNEIVTKELALAYKKYLQEKQYAVRSINSMIASLNSFFPSAAAHWPAPPMTRTGISRRKD